VRLDHGDDPPGGAVASGGQDRAYLHRMVGVIVDDDSAVDFADAGEAALDPADFSNPLVMRSSLRPSSSPTATAGQRILDVVAAGASAA
jgi:hypothetical protein